MGASEIVAIVLSLTALLISSLLARRQLLIQRNANHVPAVVSVLAELRSPELHRSFEYLFQSLSSHDPAGGLSGLPEQARNHVYNVFYFLQQIGVLIVLGIINERAFLAMFRARAVAAWAAAGPFVRQERLINQDLGPEFLSIVEVLAAKAAGISPELGQEILRDWLRRPV